MELFPTCDGPTDGWEGDGSAEDAEEATVSAEVLMPRVCLMAYLNSSREKRSSGRPGMALHHHMEPAPLQVSLRAAS